MTLDVLVPASPRRRTTIFLTALMLLTPAVPGFAATQRQAVPAVERAAESQATPQAPVASDQDASQTRERLEELLRRLPPAVGGVLRTDPSLLSNESYLTPYPTLGTFLKQHPEVRSAPSYYLANVHSGGGFYDIRQESAAVQIWRDLIQTVVVSGVFLGIAAFVIWMVKTLVEYRRWNRMSRIHTEVNNKLVDRFTNNEELLAYIQTPAGRKFIESAPLPMDAPRPVGAPLSRILWSVQIGVVLAAGALGLLYISNRFVVSEVSQPLFAIGVLALTLGAGFIVSAAASYVLSRQLGLLQPTTIDAGRHATTD